MDRPCYNIDRPAKPNALNLSNVFRPSCSYQTYQANSNHPNQPDDCGTANGMYHRKLCANKSLEEMFNDYIRSPCDESTLNFENLGNVDLTPFLRSTIFSDASEPRPSSTTTLIVNGPHHDAPDVKPPRIPTTAATASVDAHHHAARTTSFGDGAPSKSTANAPPPQLPPSNRPVKADPDDELPVVALSDINGNGRRRTSELYTPNPLAFAPAVRCAFTVTAAHAGAPTDVHHTRIRFPSSVTHSYADVATLPWSPANHTSATSQLRPHHTPTTNTPQSSAPPLRPTFQPFRRIAQLRSSDQGSRPIRPYPPRILASSIHQRRPAATTIGGQPSTTTDAAPHSAPAPPTAFNQSACVGPPAVAAQPHQPPHSATPTGSIVLHHSSPYAIGGLLPPSKPLSSPTAIFRDQSPLVPPTKPLDQSRIHDEKDAAVPDKPATAIKILNLIGRNRTLIDDRLSIVKRDTGALSDMVVARGDDSYATMLRIVASLKQRSIGRCDASAGSLSADTLVDHNENDHSPANNHSPALRIDEDAGCGSGKRPLDDVTKRTPVGRHGNGTCTPTNSDDAFSEAGATSGGVAYNCEVGAEGMPSVSRFLGRNGKKYLLTTYPRAGVNGGRPAVRRTASSSAADLATCDLQAVTYRMMRQRNNQAVRRCRAKLRIKQLALHDKMARLSADNQALRNRLVDANTRTTIAEKERDYFKQLLTTTFKPPDNPVPPHAINIDGI